MSLQQIPVSTAFAPATSHQSLFAAALPADQYIKKFADAQGQLSDVNVKLRIEDVMAKFNLRVSDGCNLLLVTSRVKPTCLIVCDTAEQCGGVARAVQAIEPRMLVEQHYDPAVQKFYVICCTSLDKIDSLKSISRNARDSGSNIGGFAITAVTSDREYHVELGKFLDVPTCCLVADAVMPDAADERFKGLASEALDSQIDTAIHFSPHLPCCSDCAPSREIGRVYERWIRQEVPDFAAILESQRRTKPLYLY